MVKSLKNQIETELVMPSHYVELTEEEMCYVDGGDYFLSKETCQNILIGSGISAYIGGTVAVLLGGTQLYNTLKNISLLYYLRKGLGMAALGGLVGALVCFAVEKLIAFTVAVIGGAVYDGMAVKTLKIFGWDTGIPTLSFQY